MPRYGKKRKTKNQIKKQRQKKKNLLMANYKGKKVKLNKPLERPAKAKNQLARA